MTLTTLVALRDEVAQFCARVDAGELPADTLAFEVTAVLLAQRVHQADPLGPLGRDLLYQIAARCHYGREALKKLAQ